MSGALAKLQSKMEEAPAAVALHLHQLEKRKKAEAEQEQKSREDLEREYRKAAEESDKRAMGTIAELKEQMRIQQEEQKVLLRQQWTEAAQEKHEYLKRLDEVARRRQRPKGRFNGDTFERCEAPYRFAKPSSTLVELKNTDSPGS